MRLPLGAALSLVLLATSPASAQTFLGPTAYLSQTDSPFAAAITAGDVVLEDFEDGILDVVGVTTNGGVIGPSSITDSVDADDGSIDGSGAGGNSLFSGSGSSGISFDFAPGSLPVDVGALRTRAAHGLPRNARPQGLQARPLRQARGAQVVVVGGGRGHQQERLRPA